MQLEIIEQQPETNMMQISKTPRVYIAGPFFNEHQIETIEDIKEVLDHLDLTYFSPKDECMYVPGETPIDQILRDNVEAMHSADLLICVTDGKDPGTIFEAGWCYAMHKPIIYIWRTRQEGQKFNLVLASSGSVVQTLESLTEALEDIMTEGVFIQKNYDTEGMHYE